MTWREFLKLFELWFLHISEWGPYCKSQFCESFFFHIFKLYKQDEYFVSCVYYMYSFFF